MGAFENVAYSNDFFANGIRYTDLINEQVLLIFIIIISKNLRALNIYAQVKFMMID